MAYFIPPPSRMEMDGDLRENWAIFKQTWSNYLIATERDKKSKAIQVGTLLSLIGKECLQTLNNIPMTAADKADPEKILDKLTEYFEPKQNKIYQRYLFNSCSQEHGERFETYLHKLRGLLKSCKYGILENELLRDRIVIGTNNQNIRAKLLSESGLTLDRTIDICRTTEQAELQLVKLNNTDEPIHYTTLDKRTNKDREFIKDCRFCGQSHFKGKCQAYGLTCAACLKKNHVARVCQSRTQTLQQNKYLPDQPQTSPEHGKVRYVEEEPASSDESIYALDPLSSQNHFYADVHISAPGDRSLKTQQFQIDTGATCCTLSLADYRRVTTLPLQPSRTKLRIYGGSVLRPLGTVTLLCETNGIRKKVNFQVVDSNSPSLLSGRASLALDLISFGKESHENEKNSKGPGHHHSGNTGSFNASSLPLPNKGYGANSTKCLNTSHRIKQQNWSGQSWYSAWHQNNQRMNQHKSSWKANPMET